jgi:hypothetical protein
VGQEEELKSVGLAYGDSPLNLDRVAYIRLALSVVVRAVKDVSKVGGVSKMQQAYFQKTAREFLSDPSNKKLNLWCAWLKVDPHKIHEATDALVKRHRHE